MTPKMNKSSRLILALASLALAYSFFVPLWSIYLIAPQYPEGLAMQIWLHKLTGDIDIINGLNHYIGMKKIDAAMFPELQYLVYVVAFYILYGLVVAIIGRRWLLLSYLILIVAGGIAALVDFYKWGYNYGHNLDASAPIKVPGLSYQPPLIGHKKLLNFDAFSYPDTGGWVVIIVSVIFFIVWFFERRRAAKKVSIVYSDKVLKVAAVVAGAMLFAGCHIGPEKINYGTDNCAGCKMTIMDKRFGGEILTKKGKVFKFDDAHCLAVFLKDREVEMSDLHSVLFTDYDGAEKFLNTKTAVFVLGSQLKSPMGSNAAAFATKKAAEKKALAVDGKTTDWAILYNVLIK